MFLGKKQLFLFGLFKLKQTACLDLSVLIIF